MRRLAAVPSVGDSGATGERFVEASPREALSRGTRNGANARAQASPGYQAFDGPAAEGRALFRGGSLAAQRRAAHRFCARLSEAERGDDRRAAPGDVGRVGLLTSAAAARPP